jgi:hypothetical protein
VAGLVQLPGKEVLLTSRHNGRMEKDTYETYSYDFSNAGGSFPGFYVCRLAFLVRFQNTKEK